MLNYFTWVSLLVILCSGCSKSSLENLDLESVKKKTIEKQEDFEKIQEKLKKIKKKL